MICIKVFGIIVIFSLVNGDFIYDYMPHMYGKHDRNEDQRNILDDTCQVLNVSEVFLNNDSESKMNTEGQITILFKIAPHYLYLDQIAMIRQLRNRFDENGYNALQFLLIISHLGEENFQIKFENEIKLLMMNDNLDVIKETKESKPLFQMSDNQAYILDECGRLTYIIVPPWSHIQFPYIKAGILSTIYDFPCGLCEKEYVMPPYPGYGTHTEISNETEQIVEVNESIIESNSGNDFVKQNSVDESTTTEILDFKIEETTWSTTQPNVIDYIIKEQPNYDWTEDSTENLVTSVNENNLKEFNIHKNMIDDEQESSATNFSIPLKIIFPVEHLHYNGNNETYSKYNYIILKTGDQSYHGHLDSDKPTEMENVLTDTESNAKELLNGLDEDAKELYISQTGQIYQLFKEYFVNSQKDNFKEVLLVDTDIIRDEPKITNLKKVTDIRRHYEYLVQWLTWQFEI